MGLIYVALIFFGQIASAQTVALKGANILSCENIYAIYVTGTLTGSKGIPITGYTIDLITNSDSEPVRIQTNVSSSGGDFQFIGLIPPDTKITSSCQIRVTTNRQVSSVITPGQCPTSQKTYYKAAFGYNNCTVQWGPLQTNVSEEDMVNLANAANAEGFTYQPDLKYGKVLIGSFPSDCQSQANLSWPLYLAK